MNSGPRYKNQVQYPNQQSELPLIELHNNNGRAQICLQGGQIMRYQPKGQPDVIWLGTQSLFEKGKAIRGGIPICWPWFGDHPSNQALPAHGLVRTRLWRVLERNEDQSTSSLRLSIEDDQDTRQLWPYKFRLELLIQLDHKLKLTLSTHNPNDVEMLISEALHSYFAVSNIGRIQIEGLEGACFRDKLDHLQQGMQRDPLTIRSEIDQIYENTGAPVTINDAILKRRLIITKANSRSTVVWNPWAEKARALADFGDLDYKTMLCVETANVLGNELTIPPGGSHSISTTIESQPLG